MCTYMYICLYRYISMYHTCTSAWCCVLGRNSSRALPAKIHHQAGRAAGEGIPTDAHLSDAATSRHSYPEPWEDPKMDPPVIIISIII